MDFQEYRLRGKEMVDYIADYLENIRDRKVFPDVKPGYMRNLLPDSAPVDGEKWDTIFDDVERVIMPGVTHWQSPHMHAYFPALNSFPSLLADMLADAINCLGFTWASSPACTELEIIVMNWLGKMIGLPDDFLHLNNNSKGGGVIQTTASESTLVALLAGRTRAIRAFHDKNPGCQDAEINARLVAYCSDQAHSSVEKAALIGLVRMRYIESDENLSMRGELLREAIDDDMTQGLIPFWVCATLGTTGTCAFDNLEEVGQVCREYNLWLHVDAAYAGSAFICPEYRVWLKGIERADSLAFNPSKWLMVHFDCTALWVTDSTAVHRTFNVEPLYLQHENSGLAIDYMHWQIPLSKRFRSLKLWFVLRSFGIKGLQKHIREGVRLAQKFEALVLADHRFEIPARRHLGMVVFRIKGQNDVTERLLKRLNHRGNLHCVPASIKGKYVIRFTVTSSRTTVEDIVKDWTEIRRVTTMILAEMNENSSIANDRAKVSLKDTKVKNEAFGSSLLLSNSPLSPKIVNGSFAAIFDADEFLAKSYAGIRIAHQESPSMRRRVRGILMSDSHMDIVMHTGLNTNKTSIKNDECGTKTKSNPIREDNEDSWEAYESLGTPPNSPPPTISPLLLSPKFGKNATSEHQTSTPAANIRFDAIRVLNRTQTPPNTLTLQPPSSLSLPQTSNLNCNSRIADNIVSTNRFEKSSHHHNKHHLGQQHSSFSLVQHHFRNSSQPVSETGIASATGRTGSKRKNIYTYSCNSRRSSISIRTKLCGGDTSSEDEIGQGQHCDNGVYHGKRYLDPVSTVGSGSCGFVNNGFKTIDENGFRRTHHHHHRHHHQQSKAFGSGVLPEISENDGAVDWEAVRTNFNETDRQRLHRGSHTFPKLRIRIDDENGRRVQSSFDSSGGGSDESCSPQTTPHDAESPQAIWSSVECDSTTTTTKKVQQVADDDKSSGDMLSGDEDSVIIARPEPDVTSTNEVSVIATTSDCCEKCGHENNTTPTTQLISAPKTVETISTSSSSSISSTSVSIEELVSS